MITLTNHKKSVRALALHPKYYAMGSASPDNIKEWKLPKAEFIQNLSGHDAILNALACNSDDVLVSAGKFKINYLIFLFLYLICCLLKLIMVRFTFGIG